MIDSLSSAAACMDGVLQGADRSFEGVSTDTRSIRNGELFFALHGPNFDGHHYVEKAAVSGAAAAVVARLVDDSIAQIKVDDVKLALGRFAAAWRKSKKVRVVGITGSNGKTTLKDLTAACLASQAPTLATHGNLNNDIGLPLMLARIKDEHRFAVLEMGANHAGEIAYLASLANPEVVVITNAGEAHLEGFGSIEGVAHAKGEILRTDERPCFAVLNADDAFYDYWASLVTDAKVVSFGFSAAADVRAENIVSGANGSRFTLHLPDSSLPVSLSLPGTHNVRNACAAAAVATALNVDAESIKLALERARSPIGRLQPLSGKNGCRLFDDTYNANPVSVTAAAEFLASLEGESWLVLGDMKELGEGAQRLHRVVGESARFAGVDRLFALGELSQYFVEGFGAGASWYAGIDALIAAVSSAGRGVNVLVKGSRSMRMEQVIQSLSAIESVAESA